MTPAPKRASCFRCPSNTEFTRTVTIERTAREVVDAALQPLGLIEGSEYRLVRRYTGLACRKCGNLVRVNFA